MANHLRGEADFSFVDIDDNEHHYTLNYNNQAKMSIETELGMTRAEIVQRFLNSEGEADNIRFALLRHGLRKHHRQLFKAPPEVQDILEEFDTAKASAEGAEREALSFEFLTSIMGAYTRQDKNYLKALLKGEIEPDEGGDSEATQEEKAPKGNKKKDQPPSEPGSSS